MAEIFTIRASSFGELFDCAYRWEGKHLLRIPRASSGVAHLGTCLHEATGTFDREHIAGTDIRPDDAAGVFVHALHHPVEEVNWGGDSVKAAERIGISLTTKYCAELAPQFAYKAVEMQLEPMDIQTQHGVIRLTGRMDRARVATNGTAGVSIRDLKSGKRAVNPKTGLAETKGHAPQIGVYELLYEHTTKEAVTEAGGIIGLQTVEEARIGVADIPNARAQLIGTDGQPGLIEMAAQIFHSGLFTPNPQSRLCGEKYCPRWSTCAYHD